MNDFSVTNVGVYRTEQRSRQQVLEPWICFCVSGLHFQRAIFPDGSVLDLPKPPFFVFYVPGTDLDFAYGPHRENWVIFLDTQSLQYAPAKRCLEWRDGEDWIALPIVLPVSPEWVPYWQSELQLMQTALESPLPRNRWRARLGVFNILRFALDGRSESLNATPAEEMKRRIDEDENCSRTLEEWAAVCGYSSDHLRVLFRRAYGVTPLAYRNQRRMARAVQLMANSRSTVKEIATQLGFRYLSHFSAAFSQAFHCTPREGIQRFRHS